MFFSSLQSLGNWTMADQVQALDIDWGPPDPVSGLVASLLIEWSTSE
jgi:hypothetical protein